MALRRNYPDIVSTRTRLPTLAECLKRNTRPPVDLYCFYLFLQREGSEDTLDFWLDVQQHENLCRAYFKDLTKSGESGPELVEQDWPRYAFYAKTRGSIYNKFTGIERDYDLHSDDEYDALATTRSGMGESSSEGHGTLARGAEAQWRGGQRSGYEQKIDGEEEEDAERLSSQEDHSRLTPPTNNPAYPQSTTLKALYPFDKESGSSTSLPIRRSNSPFQRKRASTTQPFIQRSSAISRTDLVSSAERIYSRYLMPGSEKEVYLPSDIRITQFTLISSSLPSVDSPEYEGQANEQAKVPDMFHLQKEYIYNQMREETFPRFLRAKGFGNLTAMSSLIRLGVGLMSLWVGLASAFAFIFLNTQPRSTRLWIILPFTFAVFNLLAHAYDLDVILVFMGLSETTPFRTIGIKEPYVRKLLFGRALYLTLFASLIIAALTVLFYFVPGHRL